MNKLNDLAFEYAGLLNGDTHRDKCPFCNAEEKSFVITRIPEGLLYNCFRVTCGESGFIPTRSAHTVTKAKDWVPNPYRKPYKAEFPLDISQYIQQKYHLSYIPCDWRWNASDNELVMPVRTEGDVVWGYQAKSLWPKPFEQKVKTYAELQYSPRIHIPYYASYSNATYFVVEDPISAKRIEQNDRLAIALLGTVFNDVKAMHLHNIGIKNLIFCLDKDAWKKAMEFKRQYDSLFHSIKVRVWNSGDDVKDMTQDEFNEVIK